jgi:lysophospholipase
MDFRGQGGSDRWPGNPQKAYSQGMNLDARDLAQFIRKSVAPQARGPVFIVAQSLGGHIALRALHDHADLARALVLSSPAISFQAESLSQRLPPWLLRIVARVAVLCGLGDTYSVHAGDWEFFAGAGGASDPVRDDPARALASEAWMLKNPMLREGGMTWAFVDERFRSSALELSAGWMQEILAPVLIGTARTDALTDVSATAQSCRAMKRCQLMIFPHAKHALLGDSDVTRVPFIEASTQFLVRQAASRTGIAP